jgi:hypothetical protein
VLATGLTGLAVDAIIAKLRPWPERPGAFRALAMLMPALLWSGYFAAFALTDGVGWTLEVASGTIVWAILSGLALSLVMLPPPIPDPEGPAAQL